MKEEIQKYEDRYGSSDFEDGKGANLQKLVDRKEKRQMKQFQIKPTDTFADRVKKVIAEENPSKLELRHKERFVAKKKQSDDAQDQKAVEYLKAKGLNDENIKKVMSTPYGIEALKQSNSEENQNDDLDADDKEDVFNDEVEEKRIKIMQFMNPRVVRSSEMKNFMDRSNVKEELIKSLNELATHKLDLFKKIIALEEGNKENKEKLRNFMRNVGTKGAIKGFVPFDMNHSPLRSGRKIARNEPTEKQQQFNLIPRSKLTPDQQAEAESRSARLQKRLERGEINSDMAIAADAEALRQAHYGLHEETEQLDEANRNVMRQGRTNVVKVRVRKGKVQRRKRVSAVKGYTIRGGKLKRMSMQERIRRKRGQRRGKVKRRAKMARALMRRKRSMRRRASLGV